MAAITFDDGYYDNYTMAFPRLKSRQLPATVFLATGYVGTAKGLWCDELRRNLREVARVAREGRGTDREKSEQLLVTICGLVGAPRDCADLYERVKRSSSDRAAAVRRWLDEADIRERSGSARDFMSWAEVKEMSAGGISFGAHTVNHVNLTTVNAEVAQFEVIESRGMIEEQLRAPSKLFAYPDGGVDAVALEMVANAGFEGAVTTRWGRNVGNVNALTLSRTEAGADAGMLFRLKMSGAVDWLMQWRNDVGPGSSQSREQRAVEA